MPATGVRAPERMLVAVRAIAPVAGSPPNIGDARLAIPWAINSTFGLCLSPHIRSATTAPIEPKAGTDLELSIRNNWPAIQTYFLEASGDGLEFFPPKTELIVGATEERRTPLRIFAKEGAEGLRAWNLKVTGAATLDLPMRVVLIPRGRTVAWSADLDGDGSPEWVLETQKVRAVFSAQDGGRWMEFNWKDTNLNYLPDQ